MSEEIINKLKVVVSDLESIRDKHRLDFSDADKYEGLMATKINHNSKADAYDYVIRKLNRTFNLLNDGKETNT